MLVVFAANFFVVCHCVARTAAVKPVHSCCQQAKSSCGKDSPCKDGKECNGMQAMKFNLKEKKASPSVTLSPVYVLINTFQRRMTSPAATPAPISRQRSSYHPPPDFQSLYQCFLI